jgi:hypothetical protein
VNEKIPYIPGLTVTRGRPTEAPQPPQATTLAPVVREADGEPAPGAAPTMAGRWASPGARRAAAAKLTSVVPDNGKVHYGSNMPGSLCGVHSRPRREVAHTIGVTCPNCLKILKGRP